MNIIRRVIAVVVLGFAGLLVIAPSAGAAGEDERILSFTAGYVLDKEGGATVTETIVYRFPAGQEKRGILRAIVVKQGVETTSDTSQGTDPASEPQTVDSEQDPTGDYRYYALSDVTATSPSGAPAGVARIESLGAANIIYVGDASTRTSGTQTYVVRYHLANVLNAFADHNELYYNVFGTNDRIPKDNVVVTVTGPGGVTKVACYVGEAGSRTQCPGATPGPTARFTVGPVPAGSALTVVNWLPLSGYGTIAPQIRSGSDYAGEPGYGSPSISETAASTVSTLALSTGFGAPIIAAAGMALLVRSRGRDEVYADVTPGLKPTAGSGAVRRGGLGPVAVQFTPPAGVQPGMVGTIIDEEAGTIDVSATVVDLAVRGFLRIEEVAPGHIFAHTDWVLTRLPDPSGAPLLPYEEALIGGIFASGNSVQLSDLRNHFAPTLARVRSLMYDEVVRRGWFRRSPESQRARWQVFGMALVGLGAAAGFWGGSTLSKFGHIAGTGLPVAFILGGGLAVAGAVVWVFGRQMAWRTADGSAVLAQSRGFREYLVTAEADQIAFDEAQQIFSRYLPYAVVFGVADRWAKVFAQVAAAAAAAGQSVLMPSWYVWNGTTFPDFGGIASGVESFSTTAGGTFTSTPGSSGGSGFGGGFSGGGVGGSSSGSW